MKVLRLGIAAIVVSGLMPMSTAAGATESTASCVGMWHVNFSPGLGSTPQKSAFTAPRGSGPLNCVGTVNGRQVVGAGTVAEEGVLEGTTVSGTGHATLFPTIPTSAGAQEFRLPYTLQYGPGFGLKHADSMRGPATFAFYPTAGDGVTEPVTQIAVVVEFILNS